MYQIPYLDGEPRETFMTKCSNCSEGKELKEHQFIVVTPESPDADPMEILTLAKRLIICINCGTMKLVN